MLFDARSHTGQISLYFTDGWIDSWIEYDLPENAAICAIILAHCYNDDLCDYLFCMSLLLC